ncbi:unnamed protein product [Meloidogyne enterolobii]|uniref:Uncharacterized protein n=1 Tax=Meloidogyne enterolobii TaxID=390850 RepID=A0ACB0XY21_MELEN
METKQFPHFYGYYNYLASLIQQQTWEAAQKYGVLISCNDSHADLKFLQIPSPEKRYYDRSVTKWPVFGDLVLMHLNVLNNLNEKNWHSAFIHQTNMLKIFNQEILQKEKDANWFCPILYILCSDLRLVAKIADKQGCTLWSRSDTQTSTFYEEAASPIMESYRICVAESRLAAETTKKIAILNLTNQLFRIYFGINRLHLLKPLIRSIDHDLAKAEDSLTFSFENCPANYVRNKRLILMYLIPVKMFLGHMPTQQLLLNYNLQQFSDVVTSVKDGNLRELNAALHKHQHFFIKCGIFLMLEKLKGTTYRNLFKKIALILNTHLIKLEAFLAILHFLGTDIDADELACILANLIAQKKIKGYISHQKQTLVIAKQKAFPPLSAK